MDTDALRAELDRARARGDRAAANRLRARLRRALETPEEREARNAARRTGPRVSRFTDAERRERERRRVARYRAKRGRRIAPAVAARLEWLGDLGALARAVGRPRDAAPLRRIERRILDSGGEAIEVSAAEWRALRRVLGLLGDRGAEARRVLGWGD